MRSSLASPNLFRAHRVTVRLRTATSPGNLVRRLMAARHTDTAQRLQRIAPYDPECFSAAGLERLQEFQLATQQLAVAARPGLRALDYAACVSFPAACVAACAFPPWGIAVGVGLVFASIALAVALHWRTVRRLPAADVSQFVATYDTLRATRKSLEQAITTAQSQDDKLALVKLNAQHACLSAVLDNASSLHWFLTHDTLTQIASEAFFAPARLLWKALKFARKPRGVDPLVDRAAILSPAKKLAVPPKIPPRMPPMPAWMRDSGGAQAPCRVATEGSDPPVFALHVCTAKLPASLTPWVADHPVEAEEAMRSILIALACDTKLKFPVELRFVANGDDVSGVVLHQGPGPHLDLATYLTLERDIPFLYRAAGPHRGQQVLPFFTKLVSSPLWAVWCEHAKASAADAGTWTFFR